MIINYRQGLIKSQVDASGVPTYLNKSATNGYVDLYINASVVVLAFAHRNTDYIYEEGTTVLRAWGPFTSAVGVKNWLFWDIDINTGLRSFGSTLYQPIVSDTAPVSPLTDQHWFDIGSSTMKVWYDFSWHEKIRCFAGVYSGGQIVDPYYVTVTTTSTVNGVEVIDTSHEYFTSHVGLNNRVTAGFILFDDGVEPVKSSANNTFLTTESHFYTTKSNVSSISFDLIDFYAESVDTIPAFRVVSYYQNNTIALAACDDPSYRSAVGVTRNPVFAGEVTSVITSGYVTNVAWNYNVPPATPLYLGTLGQLVTVPPAAGFIQKVATVVSSDTILISIDPQLIFKPADFTGDTTIVNIDALSGKFYTANSTPTYPASTGPAPELNFNIIGYTYNRAAYPNMFWHVEHNMGSRNVFVQVYDHEDNYVAFNSVKVVDENNIIIGLNTPMMGMAQLLFFTSTIYTDLEDTNIPVTEYTQPAEDPKAVWSVYHALGYKPISVVYDHDGNLIVPASIRHSADGSSLEVSFNSPTSGIIKFL